MYLFIEDLFIPYISEEPLLNPFVLFVDMTDNHGFGL